MPSEASKRSSSRGKQIGERLQAVVVVVDKSANDKKAAQFPKLWGEAFKRWINVLLESCHAGMEPKRDLDTNTCRRPISAGALPLGTIASKWTISQQPFTWGSLQQSKSVKAIYSPVWSPASAAQLIMAPTSSSINLNPTCIQISWASGEKASGLWNHWGGGSTGGSNWKFRDLPCHNVSEKVFNVISHDRLAVEIQLTVLEMA